MCKFKFIILLVLTVLACEETTQRSDAYGNFEATATTISAAAAGQLLFLNLEEGDKVTSGSLVALVDTTQLHLRRKQLQASIATLPKKLRNTIADIAVLKNQKANLIRERDRVSRLLQKKAATPKQLDDLEGNIAVLDKQIIALESQTKTSNNAILSEKEPLLAQIALIDEQIRKAYVYNPIEGTVLTKMAEAFEMVQIGSPLYRIGQLDTMTLRFYVDAVQLQQIPIGAPIQILIDQGKEGYKPLTGQVSWIAEQAEFTPKTIQTKEDRVNLVYAVKAKVPNPEGRLKIGMPAEVNFTTSTAQNTEK